VRRKLAARYGELLSGTGITPPAEPAWARSNYQSYCVRLPAGCDQRAVMQAMLEKAIATRRGIMNAHRERVYAETPLRLPLPNSEAAQDGCILLPLYPQMTEAEQAEVVAGLKEACRLQ
jgi:dTDP-4-amino-4,6-dideoxygalactose transaminase